MSSNDLVTTGGVVDGRCHCGRCTDPRWYLMLCKCFNCRADAFALFRHGDRARDIECPHCGVSRLHPLTLERTGSDCPPESPTIDEQGSEGTRTPQEPQTGTEPPTVRLDPEWMYDGMWPKRRLSRDVPHANPQRED